MPQFRDKPTQIDLTRPPVCNPVRDHPTSRWVTDITGHQKKLEFGHLLDHDPFPLPMPVDREGYLPEHDHFYWASGYADWLNIVDAVTEFNIVPQPGQQRIRLLDVGCSTGRVLRHAHVFGNGLYEAWGTDLAPANVNWMQRHLPQEIQTASNSASPPLNYDSNFFDVVTGFSLLPHIDDNEMSWIEELKRITNPDGLLLITVANEATWAAAGEREDTIQHFVRSNHIAGNAPFSKTTFEQPLPGDRIVRKLSTNEVYNCFIWRSNAYLHQQWSKCLDIHRIVDRAHMGYQSVMLARPNDCR